MQFSRRRFLLGASTLAIFAARPASAFWHGSALSGFNNGKSQLQSWNLNTQEEIPFINLMKCATAWGYNDNTGAPLPNELNSDGYPTTIVHTGVKTIVKIFPPSAGRTSTYALTWSGNGTLFLSVPNSGSITTVSGSLTSNGGSGRYEFTTTSPDALVVGISAIGSPIVTDIKLFYKADETALNSGQIFGVQFLSVLRALNPGVIRFLDWGAGSTTNMTTWATRRPQTYYTWNAPELRPSIYAGTTTNVGIKYSATFSSGAPVDKQTIQINWNDNAVSVSVQNPGICTWTAHGMNVGQPFIFQQNSNADVLPSAITMSSPNNNFAVYYVTSVIDANHFNFSATKGGTSLDCSGGPATSGSPTGFATAVPQVVTMTNANPAVISWTNHGLNIGDPVSIQSDNSFGMPPPFYNSQTFYVISAGFGTNSFQVSLTPGGTAISTAAENVTGCTSGTNQPVVTISGNTFISGGSLTFAGLGGLTGINGVTCPIIGINVGGDPTKVTVQLPSGSVTGTYTSGGTATPAIVGTLRAFGQPSLNLNGTGNFPILAPYGDPISQTSAPWGGRLTATLTFDAGLGGWLMLGGTFLGSSGIENVVPPEIQVALCTAVGAHPHFVAPYMAVDPMTDFIPQLATYVKTSGPSWMKPRFEGPNELWNPFPGPNDTRYAWNKAPANWGPSFYLDTHNWYGKILSTIGQAVNAVYGGTPGTQTNYAILCGVQTDQNGGNQNDNRLAAAAYVAQSAAAQSGYIKDHAYNWATHVTPAQYWTPAERSTPLEVIDAWNYTVTNNGNASAQAAIAASYVGTANTTANINGSPANSFALPGLKTFATNWLTWASNLSGGKVNKMCGYEGGYSPDYPQQAGGNPDATFNSTITGISKQANAVVTVGNYNSDGPVGTGAGAAVGMPVTINNVAGMTQINNPGAPNVTVTAGTPGTVVYGSAHGLSAGQAVYFIPGNNFGSVLPTGVIFGKAYYVLASGLTATAFEIAATPGGTAINISGTQVQGVSCQPCWVVTSVTTNGSGAVTSFAINVDSTGFGTYTSGGQLVYGGLVYNMIQLRQAGKFASNMQTYALQLYTDFVAAGGEFPSCFMLSGTGVVWSVYDPDVWISTPPQALAIAQFNH